MAHDAHESHPGDFGAIDCHLAELTSADEALRRRVTSLREAESQLKATERTFRLLVQSVRDYAIFMLDPDGRVVTWNAGAERIKGYGSEEIVGRHFACFYTPEDIDQGKPDRELQAAAAVGRYEDEGWRVRKDGSRFWANVILTAIRDDDGELRGFAKVTRDLTERRAVEEALRRSHQTLEAKVEARTAELERSIAALRKSEASFRLLFHANAQPMWVYDTETLAFLEVNSAATSKYGWTRDEFLRLHITDIRPPDDLPRLMADLARPRAPLGPPSEWRHRLKDGRVIDVTITSHLLEFAGRPAALVVAQDITERKRVQDALSRSASRLTALHAIDTAILGSDSPQVAAAVALRQVRALIPAERAVVYLMDPLRGVGTCVAVEQDAALGPPEGRELPVSWFPTPSQTSGRTTATVTRWNDLREEAELAPIFAELRGSGARSVLSVSLVAEGAWIGHFGAASPAPGAFSDEDVSVFGEIANQLAIVLSQVRLHAGVAAARENLAQILEELPSGVVVLEDDGAVQLANPLAREYLLALGHGDGPVVALEGHPLAELLRPRPGDLPHEIAVARPVPREFTIRASRLGPSDAPARYVMLIWDITPEREAAVQIEAQQRLAVIGEVAGGLAHDLNNVLQALIAFPERLRHRPALDPDVREVMDVVVNQAQRGATLIRRILDFSRRSPADRRPVQVAVLLEEITTLLRRTLPETITVSFSDEAPSGTVISADPTQLDQVLLNLAVNARDAMPAGGDLRIDLSVLALASDTLPPIAGMPPGEWARIGVLDTGDGIAPEHLARIFQPYFTTKPAGKGTGLGLAQVYGLVTQNDGFISVHSAPGAGTSFDLFFPHLPASTEDAGVPANATPLGEGQLILLAEDHDDVRLALRGVLEALGYRLIEAADGLMALAVLERGERPDLLLTDGTMPGMSGAELVARARKLRPDLKAVALTGYFAEETLAELRASGVAEILQKPVSVEELALVLARVLKG